MKRYYMAAYTFKPFVTPDKMREMLKLFGERGVTSGTVAHWVRRDGRGGYLIIEELDEAQAAEGFENVLAFQEYIEFEEFPVLTIEDALPSVMKVFEAA